MRFTRDLRIPTKIFLAAAVATSLILAAGLAALLFVDVNQYRDLIQRKAEEAIGRKVTLGELSLSLFPPVGIQVQQPEIEGLLRARSLTVGVRLLPLLFSRKVEVRRVVLEGPEITAARDASGRWNFEGLGSGAPAGEPGPPSAPRPFTVAKLVVRDGRLHVRDAGRSGSGGLTLDVDLDLEASVKGSGAGDLESSFDGELKGDGLLIEISGRFAKTASRDTFDITVDRCELDLAKARKVASTIGRPWPLPEGLLMSPTLMLGGRLAGEIADGSLTTLSLTDVVVRDPSVVVTRDRKGRWNFETLMGGGGSAGKGQAGKGAAVTIKNLRLAGARIAMHDEATGGVPVDLKLHDLQIIVEEMAEGRPIRMELEAKLEPRGSLKLSGTLPPSLDAGKVALPVDARLALKSIDVKSIAPYLENAIGLAAEAGTITLEASLKGAWPQSLAAAGSLDLDDVRVAGRRPATGRAEFDLLAQDSATRLRIDRFQAEVGRSKLGVKGTLDRTGGRTMADLEIPPATVDAADLADLLALANVKLPVEFSAGEPIRMQARIRGDLKSGRDLDLSGSVEVADFSFRHRLMAKPMERVSGKLTLKKDGFQVTGFVGAIGSSDIAGTMTVEGFDAPRVGFDLSSRRADFWELMSFLKDDEAATSGEGPAAQAAQAEAPDYLGKVTARGTLAIGEGSFSTLAFSDLKSTLALSAKVATLDPVGMRLYGGSVDGSAVMDMRDAAPVYTVSARAAGLDTNALLAANLGLKEMLVGSLTGQFSVTASGASSASGTPGPPGPSRGGVLGSARGSGDLRIEKGRVGAINVLKVLSRATGLMGEQSLKEVSGRLSRAGSDFSVLTAKLKVGGGKIVSEKLSLVSPDLELIDDGALDMLAGTIKIAGQVVFSEALSQAMAQEKSKAVDYFWDTKLGRVNLPLTMSGPIASPTPNIDWGAAGGKLARRKVQETIRGKLEEAGLGDLLGDRAGKMPAAPRDAAPRPDTLPEISPGELSAAIEEKEFSGNLLFPDLRIKGALRGTGITEAKARIADSRGRVLLEESLMEKVSKYYATHDRGAFASIGFKVALDGKRLAGVKGDLAVTITVADAEGHRATQNATISR